MKIHLDLDCYFVSAERTRHPRLKGKPVVVAKGSDKRIFAKQKKDGVILGDTGAFNSIMEFKNNPSRTWRDEFIDEDGTVRGIIIAKSYETKPYDIKTGTALKDALIICPGLVVLPSDHLFYQELSQKLKSFLELKIPLLEQYSIDEFFGDLDGWIGDNDTLEFITGLRDEIMDRFDLPITIGASKSKWIAKLITDKAKPFGVKVVNASDIDDFVDPIGIDEFPGIGRAVSKKLKSYYINTLGELKKRPSLLNSYGKMGQDLYKRICGIDNEPIIAYSDRRAINISRNFKAELDRNEIQRRVVILARYLSHTIMKLGLNPTTFYCKIRYEHGLKNSQSITQDRLFNERFMIDLAMEIFDKLDMHKNYKIHYIGLSVSNFINNSNQKTFSLLDYQEDKKQSMLSAGLLKIRDKYGVDVIRYGCENIFK
ncbi:MAG: DNA polymerase IV [Campylobacterales bacterium]|nr:DNA polymerase IV [Campylobacterales bacterium]